MRRRKKVAAFPFKEFSKKQKQLLYWWTESSPYKDCHMIINDGSIRSGKTISAICSFLMWSQDTFNNGAFAIVGKSVGAVTRNVIEPMLQILNAWNWDYQYNMSSGEITIGSNIYYVFGAPNESSKDTLQGLTLYGSLVDEVALIPESYFSQLVGRHVSVANYKIFCTCNPAGPAHWFKKEWIDNRAKKNILYLHFTMRDNLSLPKNAEADAKKQFTGVFAKRYIYGLWVNAEGLCYPMFDDTKIVDKLPQFVEYHVGIDVGDNHPTTFVLIGKTRDNILYVIKEYKENNKLYSAYAKDFIEFVDGYRIKSIIIDSAAPSFKRELEANGYRVKGVNKSRMTVANCIGEIGNMIANNQLFIYKDCNKIIDEFYSYSWDSKATERGEDKVIKLNDDLLDSMRYVIMENFIKNKGKIYTFTQSLF